MPVNSDKTTQWESDIEKSVAQYNEWFLKFAPATYERVRNQTAKDIVSAMKASNYLTDISPKILIKNPGMLSVLRMCTAPPIARDRLIGLAGVSKSMVGTMEKDGRIPPKMNDADRDSNLEAMGKTLTALADPVLFPWIKKGRKPDQAEAQDRKSVV